MKRFLMLFVLALSALMVSGCEQGIQKYDTLVDRDENCTQAWADYESQLTRRAALIPSLVSVVKGSAAHEEKVLREVTEARASATQVKMTPTDFEDPAKMAAFQKAQDQLKGSLSRLMMVQESYPDLKANAAFHDLQVQIEGTENRLQRSREQYNRAVKEFNTELRHVSGKILNPLTGREFKPKVYFQADEADKAVPKVDFSPAPAPATTPMK